MSPESVTDIDFVKFMQYLYFAGGIVVIMMGSVGTVCVVLGILQVKFLKPYRNRYPYQQFKSFEEFANKKPANSDAFAYEFDDPQERLKNLEQKSKEMPPLTWENATSQISSLTDSECKAIHDCVDQIHDSSKNEDTGEVSRSGDSGDTVESTVEVDCDLPDDVDDIIDLSDIEETESIPTF
jgi:hypothetical protein